MRPGRAGRSEVRIAAARRRSADPPLVLGVRWLAPLGRQAIVVVTFSREMNRKRVQDTRNYVLRGPKGRRLAIDAAVYGLAPYALFLFPRSALKRSDEYRLRVLGKASHGVADVLGTRLDGRRRGVPGSDFVVILSKRNLVRTVLAPDVTVPLGGLPGAAHAPIPPARGAQPIDQPVPDAVDVLLELLEESRRQDEQAGTDPGSEGYEPDSPP
jgi:hypothetical protein